MLTLVTAAPADRASTAAGPLAGAAIGAAFFAWIAGARLLTPTEIGWLMTGDWVPHYFGWHYFRIEPWRWPPGAVHGYYAPLGTSVGLTDSIPLVAYLLKPVSAWLPTPFQYLGPWLLACFALQGALGARLIGRRVASPWIQASGAALFVLLPTLLVRVGHAALCAHWLILWALLIATREPHRRWTLAEWAALGLAAGLVQPYLAAMVLGVLAGVTIDGRGGPSWAPLTALAAAVTATVTGWWLSGLFLLSGEGSLAAGGLGYYSMNLLAFVSPGGWSALLPELPIASEGQRYEGFQYLGLGILLLAAVAVVALVAVRRHGPPAPRLWPRGVLLTCAVMTAFAASPVVTLGSRVIVNLDGGWTAPLALFRSSGRFVWPLVYVMLTSLVVAVAGRLPRRAALAVLGVAIVVQLVDLHPAHAFRRQVARDPAFYTWQNPFDDRRWADILPAYAHVVLAPPPQCGSSPVPYEAAMGLAAAQGLSVNAGVVARRDEAARARYCRALDAEIASGALRDDTLYVVAPDAAPVVAAAGTARAVCGEIDGVWICTTPAAHAPWRDRAGFNRPVRP
jgi:hypothetical protein